MTELSKNFQHQETEDKWYQLWIDNKLFTSKVDATKKPYTIVIPPPNVTGELHVGHVLNNSIQDIFIRKARMEGYNACWVPGTDHASIATEAKVVKMLKDKGIDKNNLTREQFMEHAWEWKSKYGGIILKQLRKMGASCDWDRTHFTMDEDYYNSVIKVFVSLYEKGYIYRGTQIVNWDVEAQTTISDEEVYFKEVSSRLYYIQYAIKDSDECITIATTRPETLLGDTAICVHPDDDRFKHLVGKKALVPILNREIPIIADEYVEQEFGTGALKVTPAHDKNDYLLGKKHQLQSIDIFNPNGTLSKEAIHRVGEERFLARKNIVKDLEALGVLTKIEEIVNNVGLSERTHTVIEPRISAQWFVKMKDLSAEALQVVVEDKVHFHPQKFVNTYKHWMENIRDWCISRQLWWGQRIPAYFLPDGTFVVATSKEEALQKAQIINPAFTEADLQQENDVLDTWFSSWLWPLEVFKGISNPDNEEINYYYPTQMLVTAPEIIFFWVARMIIAGLEFKKDIPFENVFFTGIVRDEFGRKYSKSLGNSPDIFKLMEEYGADSLRFGLLIAAPAGNDIPFKTAQCEQGRNFINKIWNALKLVKSWKDNQRIDTQITTDIQAIEWFDSHLNKKLITIEKLYSEFNLSEILSQVYSLIWDDFCSWYLEMVKPSKEGKMGINAYNATIDYFERLIKLLHPFMPFFTEEAYHQLKDRAQNDFICISPYPTIGTINEDLIRKVEKIRTLISEIRAIRNKKNISPKVTIPIEVKTANPNLYTSWQDCIIKLANTSNLSFTNSFQDNATPVVIQNDEFGLLLPLTINVEEETDRIQKELAYTKGFLEQVLTKLSNEKFVANAKAEMIEKEHQKKADAEAKIKALEESLRQFQS